MFSFDMISLLIIIIDSVECYYCCDGDTAVMNSKTGSYDNCRRDDGTKYPTSSTKSKLNCTTPAPTLLPTPA
jgi:hypothetical protein